MGGLGVSVGLGAGVEQVKGVGEGMRVTMVTGWRGRGGRSEREAGGKRDVVGGGGGVGRKQLA